MPTILAIVFAIVVIGVGGYYAFFVSEEGTESTSSAFCNTERVNYCNALLAGMPTDWKATCGIPPSMDECVSGGGGAGGGGGGGGGGGCTSGTCDTAARRYCLSDGTWSARDAAEYCSNCDHCPDGACQASCGEDTATCSDDCGSGPSFSCSLSDCVNWDDISGCDKYCSDNNLRCDAQCGDSTNAAFIYVDSECTGIPLYKFTCEQGAGFSQTMYAKCCCCDRECETDQDCCLGGGGSCRNRARCNDGECICGEGSTCEYYCEQTSDCCSGNGGPCSSTASCDASSTSPTGGVCNCGSSGEKICCDDDTDCCYHSYDGPCLEKASCNQGVCECGSGTSCLPCPECSLSQCNQIGDVPTGFPVQEAPISCTEFCEILGTSCIDYCCGSGSGSSGPFYSSPDCSLESWKGGTSCDSDMTVYTGYYKCCCCPAQCLGDSHLSCCSSNGGPCDVDATCSNNRCECDTGTGESCQMSYDNFIIQLYGDYDKSDEYCTIRIEGDSLGNLCGSGCNDCSNWEEWSYSIDTADYCGDDILTVDFSDSYRARFDVSDCTSAHRACLFADGDWHCCERVCPPNYGCNWGVAFDCSDWSCTGDSTPAQATCEDFASQICRSSCQIGEGLGYGLCPPGETCCLMLPPGPE
jgi:hypothetical protein